MTDTSQIIKILQGAGTAQQDVKTIAEGVKTVQSPEFQAQIKSIAGDVEKYAYANLVLNAMATAATIGMFLYTVWGKKK
jgi:hypothetical protein